MPPHTPTWASRVLFHSCLKNLTCLGSKTWAHWRRGRGGQCWPAGGGMSERGKSCFSLCGFSFHVVKLNSPTSDRFNSRFEMPKIGNRKKVKLFLFLLLIICLYWPMNQQARHECSEPPQWRKLKMKSKKSGVIIVFNKTRRRTNAFRHKILGSSLALNVWRALPAPKVTQTYAAWQMR